MVAFEGGPVGVVLRGLGVCTPEVKHTLNKRLVARTEFIKFRRLGESAKDFEEEIPFPFARRNFLFQ